MAPSFQLQRGSCKGPVQCHWPAWQLWTPKSSQSWSSNSSSHVQHLDSTQAAKITGPVRPWWCRWTWGDVAVSDHVSAHGTTVAVLCSRARHKAFEGAPDSMNSWDVNVGRVGHTWAHNSIVYSHRFCWIFDSHIEGHVERDEYCHILPILANMMNMHVWRCHLLMVEEMIESHWEISFSTPGIMANKGHQEAWHGPRSFSEVSGWTSENLNLPSYGWLLPDQGRGETLHHTRIHSMKGGVRLWCETWHHITIHSCNGCMIVAMLCCCVRRYMRVSHVMPQNALWWLHECCMELVLGRKTEHETLRFSV